MNISDRRPEDHFVDLVSRMLELPPADRVLSLRTSSGRAIELVLDSLRPLWLRLAGTRTAGEEATARALMKAEVDCRPDLARLLDPLEPIRGVVFNSLCDTAELPIDVRVRVGSAV